MKEIFETAEMQIIVFEALDIITTSNVLPDDEFGEL